MRSVLGTLLVMTVLTSCGGAEGGQAGTNVDSLSQENEGRLTHVTSMQLTPTRFEHFFKVQGVVEAEHNAQIFPEANGRITDIKVSEGDKVTKGQVLMTLDSKVLSNQIQEVKSRLELAETIYKKQERLWEQEIGSEIQYLEAKNNYESLNQNLETLQAQLAMYTITAPFSGVVDEIMPKVGEMATPAMPAMRLINMDGSYIKADVTEGYLAKIKEGDSVHIDFPSLNASSTTTISRIGDFINPNNRTFKIRLDLKNNALALKPNLLGELKIRDYVSDSTAVVPSSLIQRTPSGEEFIYVIETNSGETVARKVMIESGMTYNGKAEVVSGLEGDELLIDKGARSIKEGDTIAVSQ